MGCYLKPLLRFLVVAILAAHTSTAQEANRGIRGVVQVEGRRVKLYTENHALVVGIGDYEHWPNLPNAVKDAREVAAALEKIGFKVRKVENPDSQKLKDELERFANDPGRRESVAMVVFFAGHGDTEVMADGSKLGYIIPSDCPLQARDRMGFRAKAVSMSKIEELSKIIHSRHVLMLFDSCFSGSLFNLTRDPPAEISEKCALPVRQFITAGSENETVPDRSMFKQCVLDGLSGFADYNKDKYVTASELGMYLQSKVVNYTRGAQHPQYGKINNPRLDKGDFVFFLPDAEATSTPVAPAATVEAPEPERTGSLEIAVQPEGAEVYLDGKRIGASKADAKLKVGGIAAGTHEIKASREGYQTASRRLEIKPGKELPVVLQLERDRPKTPDWAWDYMSKHQLTESEELGLPVAVENSIGMRFMLMPPGEFMMGSNEGDDDEKPAHRVRMTKPFYMGQHEVTNGQYRQFKPAHSSGEYDGVNLNDDKQPVVLVSWNDAVDFCAWLSKKTGQQCRLPTEAEWEYACRAERQDRFWWGDSEENAGRYANTADRTAKRKWNEWTVFRTDDKYAGSAPVGSFDHNRWGLCDMLGNVWEWCADYYDQGYYRNSPPDDPKGPGEGTNRVLRGGGWDCGPKDVRSADRAGVVPTSTHRLYGFRVVILPR